MNRDPRLRLLSADHQRALLLARQAREAAADPDLAPAAWVVAKIRFHDEIEPHLAVEEELLYPALVEAGEGALVALARAQHGDLHACIHANSDPSLRLFELADALEAHVRLEERRLFEIAQSRLDAPALDAVAEARAAQMVGLPR